MKNNQAKNYKWAYLPFVFSSAAILVSSVTAAPYGSQQYQPARQVNSVNHEYVGGRTQAGVSITDDGDIGLELNHAFSETKNSSSSVGLWADYDVKGDDKGIQGRGIQLNHNWVSSDKSHVNKVTAAYDRNANGHDKATLGYGQETESMFWEGHVSKGLSGRKSVGHKISDKAYDYGVGGSVGTFLKDSNMRIRAGLDHEWSDDVGVGEKDAKNTTLSAGVEKFFQGTPHSLGLDIAASKKSGGLISGDDTDVNGRLSYRYDFGGASIYQPDRLYKRVRVEVPGKAVAPRYAQQRMYKRVPTYKTVPTYGKKTIRKPYKQLVKSTMGLEGQTFFKLNSAKLIPSAQNRLKQIATQIRKNGYKGSIRITGNTCGLGNAAYDQRLSEQRAQAVRNFLIKSGFNANHLVARGLGKAHPKFPNTPEQGFKNRRVDIEYVSERKAYKTAYRTETQNVRTGTRRVATGFKNVPAGTKNVLVSSGRPGSPRVVWRTEVIPTSPAWIKRALHNNIKHDRNVNTFTSTDRDPAAPVNTAPVANNDNDAETYSCGTSPRVINLVGNDTDANGDALTISHVDQPQYGTAVISADGTSITYTPNGSGCGKQDTFNYTISDGNGGTATATVTINMDAQVDTEVNAEDDVRSTNENTPVLINVLGNDDTDATIKSIVSQPTNGTAVIENGRIRYTPNHGFTGIDTFTYEVTDANGNTDIAEVTVTVNGTIIYPDASDDSVTLETCSSKVINVLSNDNQGSGNATVAVTSGPSHGTAVVLADGTIKYTPVDDYVGSDSFQYTITDSNGNTSIATVNVTVTNQCQGGNTAPDAVNDADITDMNTPVTIDVIGSNDSDPDGDDLTISSFTQGTQGGVVTRGSNGQLTYTPANGFVGTDTFTYMISDGNGGTDTATVTVVVAGSVNTAPDAVNDSDTTDMNTPVTIDVVGNNDTDPEDDNLTITSYTQGAQGGAVTRGSNGQLTYTPVNGFTGTDTFTYTISDGNGGTDTATVTVTVNGPANQAPVANTDTASAGCDAVTIRVLDNDTDVDGDALSIIGLGGPSLGTAVVNGNTVVYTPTKPCRTGIDTFTYTISDGHGHEATANISVDVQGNDPINVVNDRATTQENTGTTIDVLANDDSDLMIVDVSTPANGYAEILSGNKIAYLPKDGFSGTDSFIYTVKNSAGETAQATVTVKVKKASGGVNTAPDAVEDAESTTKDTAITIDVLANDTDPENDTLSIVSITQPSGAPTTSISNGKIRFDPKGVVGSISFSYTISDGHGHTANAVVTVGSTDPNSGNIHDPVILDDEVTTKDGVNILIDVLANDSDADGDTLILDQIDSGNFGETHKVGNKILYKPIPGMTGTDTFYYGVHDGHGHNGSGFVTVHVVK